MVSVTQNVVKCQVMCSATEEAFMEFLNVFQNSVTWVIIYLSFIICRGAEQTLFAKKIWVTK
jgi:hypothetical protein